MTAVLPFKLQSTAKALSKLIDKAALDPDKLPTTELAAVAMINTAPTQEARLARKLLFHSLIYSGGPQTIRDALRKGKP